MLLILFLYLLYLLLVFNLNFIQTFSPFIRFSKLNNSVVLQLDFKLILLNLLSLLIDNLFVLGCLIIDLLLLWFTLFSLAVNHSLILLLNLDNLFFIILFDYLNFLRKLILKSELKRLLSLLQFFIFKFKFLQCI